MKNDRRRDWKGAGSHYPTVDQPAVIGLESSDARSRRRQSLYMKSRYEEIRGGEVMDDIVE